MAQAAANLVSVERELISLGTEGVSLQGCRAVGFRVKTANPVSVERELSSLGTEGVSF